MKFIIYILMLILLVIQGQGHPNKEEIKGKFLKCLDFKKYNTDECKDLTKSIFRDAEVTLYQVKLYKRLVTKAASDYSKCLKSERSEHDCDLEKADREKIISQVKKELHPWVEVDEMCEPYKTDVICDNMIAYYHLPDKWGKEPETILAEMKWLLAVQSHVMGKDTEDTEFFKNNVRVITFPSKEEGEL